MAHAQALDFCESSAMLKSGIKDIGDLRGYFGAYEEYLSKNFRIHVLLAKSISMFKKQNFSVDNNNEVWMAMTPVGGAGSVGSCSDEGCNGEFLFEDGVTAYDYATSGLRLDHTDPTSECLVAVHDDILDDPVLASTDCDALRYTLCQCSPFNF